jgi:hypothetical protein
MIRAGNDRVKRRLLLEKRPELFPPHDAAVVDVVPLGGVVMVSALQVVEAQALRQGLVGEDGPALVLLVLLDPVLGKTNFRDPVVEQLFRNVSWVFSLDLRADCGPPLTISYLHPSALASDVELPHPIKRASEVMLCGL